MNKEKLLLIDGYSIVNRAFYGLPPLTNSEGLHTNAIYGFLNIFLNAYNEFRPDYCIVAFDVRQKTFRHELYDAYKGNRKPMPDELHEQVPPLKDVLHSMGIRTAELAGYEADDVIGTYASKAAADGLDVVILSGDRDLLQLAKDTTLVAIPKTKSGGTEVEKYYAADVKEKYNVTPEEFIDMKALMGDTSDNIPGIPGIGEKTASNIISKYSTLENAYAHIEEITPNRARENLRTYIEQGRLSRILAQINTNVPLEMDYHDGRVVSESDFYNDGSYELLKGLELNRILARFDIDSLNRKETIEYEIRDLKDTELTENAPFGLFVDPSGSLSAVSDGEHIYVYKGVPQCIYDLIEGEYEVRCFDLKGILHTLYDKEHRAEETSDGQLIFDLTVISDRSDRDISFREGIYDLGIMAYLLNPLNKTYYYDNISKDYLGKVIPSRADLLGKKSVPELLKEDEGKCCEMAAYSAFTAYNAYEALKNKLDEEGMADLFTDIEMPLIYSLYNMEHTGVCVDRKALNDLSEELLDMIERLQAEIYEEAGCEFNLNSPSQLGNVLFDKLKLPHGKKTKTGYSTSAEVLEKLAEDFPIVTKILEYRQAAKLRSTYAEGLVEYISEDGRIHGTFNQTITATGRISSTEPNLQNIPIRRALGQEIRKAFAAKEGCVFVDADYSQIELRLLAHMSGDENLIEAYYSDSDIHKVTASKVFHTPLDEVTKEQRSNAKAVNFGIVYGISSFGLSQGLSITAKQASEYIKQYFETYPQVKEYLDNTVKKAKIDGYVTTLFGRRRPIPELASANFMQRSFGERVAMNSPLQGTAADIMKIAMTGVDKKLKEEGLKARIVLQIHDELLVETPLCEVDKVKEILKEEMGHAAELKVPLEVDIKTADNWFEAH